MKPLDSQSGVAQILIILLVAGVLAAAGVAVWNATQAPKSSSQETSNTTKKFIGRDFSVEYPANWYSDEDVSLTSNSNSPTSAFLMLGPTQAALDTEIYPGYSGQILIYHRLKHNRETAEDYKAKEYNTTVSEREVTINGLKGKRLEWVTNEGPLAGDSDDRGKGSKVAFYRLDGEKYAYFAMYNQYTSGPLADDHLADFDRIVSTLKAK
jgi:hypothetical protein